MNFRRDLSYDDTPSSLLIACCVVCVCWLGATGQALADESAEVIAHEDIDQSYLTRGFLRSVFTLRVRSWPNGAPVKVFVLPEREALHAAFCRDVLGTYPYVLRRTWDRSTFAGTGLVPTLVSSVEEMRRRVLSTPGAVGYVAYEDDERSAAKDQMYAELPNLEERP
ncbi:MAG: hypothetical protein ACSHXK_02080 [Oceanococcus sp.]